MKQDYEKKYLVNGDWSQSNRHAAMILKSAICILSAIDFNDSLSVLQLKFSSNIIT